MQARDEQQGATKTTSPPFAGLTRILSSYRCLRKNGGEKHISGCFPRFLLPWGLNFIETRRLKSIFDVSRILLLRQWTEFYTSEVASAWTASMSRFPNFMKNCKTNCRPPFLFASTGQQHHS